MPKSPLISTIIPVYNRPHFLRCAVQSVISQSYRPIEVIIIDDGSTDDTFQTANELVALHPDEIKAFKIQNRGAGLAREYGRQQASGDFIQYLDSDDMLLPEKFKKSLVVFTQDPSVDIVYGKTQFLDPLGVIYDRPAKGTGKKRSFLYPDLLVERWWCTNTPLYSRRVTEKIGPWKGMMFGEDWEYESRAGALGAKLGYIPEFLSIVRINEPDQLIKLSDKVTVESTKTMCELLSALWANYPDKTKTFHSEERDRFARRCFYWIRRYSSLNQKEELNNLLNIAVEAAGDSEYGLRYIKLWRKMQKILGLQIMAWVSITFEIYRRIYKKLENLKVIWPDSSKKSV